MLQQSPPQRKKTLKLSYSYLLWLRRVVLYDTDTSGFIDIPLTTIVSHIFIAKCIHLFGKMLLPETYEDFMDPLCGSEVISRSRYALNWFCCIISLVKFVHIQVPRRKLCTFVHMKGLKMCKSKLQNASKMEEIKQIDSLTMFLLSEHDYVTQKY